MMPDERRTKKLEQRHTETVRNLEAEGLRNLLSTPQGRAFMWWMLSTAGVFSNPYTSNALQTAFNCGNMNYGQILLARIMEEQPGQYLLMTEENANRAAVLEKELKDSNDAHELDE
jgi:hypothetical protein